MVQKLEHGTNRVLASDNPCSIHPLWERLSSDRFSGVRSLRSSGLPTVPSVPAQNREQISRRPLVQIKLTAHRPDAAAGFDLDGLRRRSRRVAGEKQAPRAHAPPNRAAPSSVTCDFSPFCCCKVASKPLFGKSPRFRSYGARHGTSFPASARSDLQDSPPSPPPPQPTKSSCPEHAPSN